MKKLFALVLVLAMAMAIAAPAMASGWDDLTPAPKPTSGIKVELTALATTENTSVLGSLYEKLALAYPVVEGTLVHFMVKITIPANLDKGEKALIEKMGLDYSLDLTNLKLNTAKTTKAFSTILATGVEVNEPGLVNVDSHNFDETWIGRSITIEYWAAGLKKAEAKAEAIVGFYNEWKDVSGVNVFERYNKDGKLVFTVYHSGLEFGITGSDGSQILYTVKDNTKGQIDDTVAVKFYYGSEWYYIVRPTTNTLAFRLGGTETNIVSGAAYDKMRASFDAILANLGFGYDKADYMKESHFSKYFGAILEGSSSYVWPQGAVIVDPSAPKPPQTGDASTVAGFVMIALALVAAAAVTVKKVRA